MVRDGKFHFVKQLGLPTEKSDAGPQDQPPASSKPADRLGTAAPPVRPGSTR
jgi:hypothetical protein